MIRFRLQLFAAALSVCAFSACAGTTSLVAVAPADQIASSVLSRPASLTLDAAAASDARLQADTRLYVTNWNNSFTFPPATPAPIANSLSVFDLAHHSAPLPSIIVGNQLSQSYIAFDPAGKLYVSNWAAQSVSVFDTRRGNAQLPSITGVASAQGIAIDRRGKLYVANGAEIDVFDTLHGNAALPAIKLSTNANVIAFDRCGKLYVNAGIGLIAIFDTEHGNLPLPPIFFGHRNGSVTWASGITGLTVDSSGKLYAATSENSILVFDTLQSNKKLPAITGDSTFGPAGLVESKDGRLYVANGRFGNGNQIMVFDTRHGNKLLGTIAGDGMEGVNSVALQ